jgi:hypothetical protein
MAQGSVQTMNVFKYIQGIPFFTREHVPRAFDKLTAGKTLTAAQQAWLDRILAHLLQNLSIDREDFEELPVFTRHGGWTKTDHDSARKLIEFLRGVNEAVAALYGKESHMFTSENDLFDVFVKAMERHGDFLKAWEAVRSASAWRRDPESHDTAEWCASAPPPQQIPDPLCVLRHLPKDRKPTRQEMEEAWRCCMSQQ